jgi:hypothetical protein
VGAVLYEVQRLPLAGTFYSERGEPTAALKAFEHCLAEGQALKASQVQLDKRHPMQLALDRR